MRVASRCNFVADCECGRKVSYCDKVVRFKLITGLMDIEIKEDILSIEDESLEKRYKPLKIRKVVDSRRRQLELPNHRVRSVWLKRRMMSMKVVNVHIVVGEAMVLAGKKERIHALPSTNLVINAESKVFFVQSVDPINKRKRDRLMKSKMVTLATVIKMVTIATSIRLALWCTVQE